MNKLNKEHISIPDDHFAFPRTIGNGGIINANYNKAQQGMLLIDYFAGQALLILKDKVEDSDLGICSYEIAHEMLKARIEKIKELNEIKEANNGTS